jgi:hypothetical protein
MTDGADALKVEYSTVPELIDRITHAVEGISLGFDRWEEEFVSGPSLYFIVVSGASTRSYADPLGRNRWPVELSEQVCADFDAFVEAADRVAFECDGAVVISTDGTVQERMVRIRSPSATEADEGLDEVEYADWMGTKHLSAAEASVRPEVFAAVTLSEETGRVTVFQDGSFVDFTRKQLGGPWRPR